MLVRRLIEYLSCGMMEDLTVISNQYIKAIKNIKTINYIYQNESSTMTSLNELTILKGETHEPDGSTNCI